MKGKKENNDTPKSLKERIKTLTEELNTCREHQQEEYLQKSFEKANDLIIIIQEGKVKYANPALEMFIGYPLKAVEDKDFKKLLPEDSLEKLSRNYEARMQGETLPERYESVIQHKDGKRISVEISGHVIRYKGKPADFVIVRDITPRKEAFRQLQQSEEKYKNFFKASKDCVFITSPEGKWLDMSDSAPGFFGYESKEELAALPVENLYCNEKDREIDIKRIEKEGFTKEVPLNLKKKDGSVIHTLVTSQAIRDEDGQVVAYQGIIRDITEWKKYEEMLQRNKEELEETLATRDKFFSIISHDLRTPFNAIIGLSDFLRKEVYKMSTDEIESIAEDLYLAGKETYDLLTNLLEWSRTVTGKIPVKPISFNINGVIREVLQLFNEAIQRKHINLTIDPHEEVMVFADKNMIETVMRNLVSNAIKYTQPYGSVTLETLIHRTKAEVSVTDTGIGISKECQEKLFTPGLQALQKGTLGECGSGLGLVLCKEFIDRNKGEITVTSTPGKGSTFLISIPLAVD